MGRAHYEQAQLGPLHEIKTCRFVTIWAGPSINWPNLVVHMESSRLYMTIWAGPIVDEAQFELLPGF